jgi:hypothetical protein
MRLPASLLGTLRVGLATTTLAAAAATCGGGCDAVALAEAPSTGTFSTMPLVVMAVRSDVTARAPTIEPARTLAGAPVSEAPVAAAPVADTTFEISREPVAVAASEPAPKRKPRARRPVRAPEPEPKRWVCGPCGMG